MNRGKQIFVGVFLLLAIAAMGWTLTFGGKLTDNLPPIIAIFVCLMLAVAVLVPFGRPVLPRVTLGLASVALIGLTIWMALELKKLDDIELIQLGVVIVGAVLGGFYALTGKYEKDWPFAEVFARTASPSSPQPKS
jgi:hypothetical protein